MFFRANQLILLVLGAVYTKNRTYPYRKLKKLII